MPLKSNFSFVVFMYALLLFSAYATGTWGGRLLLFDLYVVCTLLMAVPQKIRTWVKAALCVVEYVVALVDIYCFDNFGSTITPSLVMLMGETNASEASNFVSAFFSLHTFVDGYFKWVLLIILMHVLYLAFHKKIREIMSVARAWLCQCLSDRWFVAVKTLAEVAVLAMIARWGIVEWQMDVAMLKQMRCTTTAEFEKSLKYRCGQVVYNSPLRRLYYSAIANRLAAKNIETLIRVSEGAVVDSCSYRIPNIVLIIGESYGKVHSSLYGYRMKTTPRQEQLESEGGLVKFTDVVSCYNLTSFVFKNMLSMHVVGDSCQWYEAPLFPSLFRKAGYHVTFISNEFAPELKATGDPYAFTGGFFLNDARMSRLLFDQRNERMHALDNGLLNDYDGKFKKMEKEYNLTIFHLMGQHIKYNQRYPKGRARFCAADYDEFRRDLSQDCRRTLSEYDNATLYNDSIVAEIVGRYAGRNAVVIYVPDHGEECYEENRGYICRNPYPQIDWEKAHYEYEIPFWIYCSPTMRKSQPELFAQIKASAKRRYMTDALPHMLMYLGGVSTKWYEEKHNILSPCYDEMRPRLLDGKVDYDSLRLKSKRR